MSKQPPPTPTASAIGPCPTKIGNVGRPGTGSLPSTIAPPDHPVENLKFSVKLAKKLRLEQEGRIRLEQLRRKGRLRKEQLE